jgi:hypothetical protein
MKMVLLMRKGWIEGLHPRDGGGRFALAPDTGINPHIGNGKDNGDDADTKQKAIYNLETMAVPMLEVAYNKNEYNKLFKGGYVILRLSRL